MKGTDKEHRTGDDQSKRKIPMGGRVYYSWEGLRTWKSSESQGGQFVLTWWKGGGGITEKITKKLGNELLPIA